MTAPPGGPTFDQNSMFYPQNSPYQHNYDNTYNLKGMWFNDSNNYPRKYEFSLEYLDASLFGPGSDLVGDREAFLLDPHHVAPHAQDDRGLELVHEPAGLGDLALDEPPGSPPRPR